MNAAAAVSRLEESFIVKGAVYLIYAKSDMVKIRSLQSGAELRVLSDSVIQ